MSPSWPMRRASAKRSMLVGWPLTMITRAPADFARGTTLAAGKTDSEDPAAINTSQRSAATIAASMTSGTRFCPKEIVSLLTMPPQRSHDGSSSPARTRSSRSSIGRRSLHPQQRV